jgi:CIC family chloride channel protein
VLVVAVLAGAACAALASLLDRSVERVARGSALAQVGVPAAAIVVSGLVLRMFARRARPVGADDYIEAFHDPAAVDASRPVSALGRLGAGALTVAGGAAVGADGPCLGLATFLAGTLRPWFRARGPNLFVTASAAALGATLHTPVAGAFMAIELPNRDGADWSRLWPALGGSAGGFLARGVIDDVEQPFRTDVGVVGIRDVIITLSFAIVGGWAIRIAARWVRRLSGRSAPGVARIAAAAVALALLGLAGRAGADQTPVTLGDGRIAVVWATGAALGSAGVVLLIRAAASASTIAARGALGLFLPLLTTGLIAGQMAADIGDGNQALLAVVGAATLLGAGYRVPFGATIWLVEVTHSVPAIAVGCVAVLIAHSIGGGRSVAPSQR